MYAVMQTFLKHLVKHTTIPLKEWIHIILEDVVGNNIAWVILLSTSSQRVPFSMNFGRYDIWPIQKPYSPRYTVWEGLKCNGIKVFKSKTFCSQNN